MIYEAWRITYQSSEAAARAAYDTVEKLHAQNVDLKAEIEALQSRVQELGEMARENRSKKVIGLEGRIAELEAQLSATAAGGVEPLRKTSADTSALRAALEEAEAALEVATSRLFARGANYPVYVTSEACALEIVRKALGKSHADHFRGVTKMMPPERACTRSHPHEKQSAVCDLQEVTDWLRHFAAGGLSISVEKATQYAAQVERVAKALKAPAILDADEIVALAAQLATGAIDNLTDQLNGQVKVAQLCKDAIEQIRARVDAANAQLQRQQSAARHWRKRFYSVKKSAKATVRQLKEELHEECRLLGASAEKELALRAQVERLERELVKPACGPSAISHASLALLRIEQRLLTPLPHPDAIESFAKAAVRKDIETIRKALSQSEITKDQE